MDVMYGIAVVLAGVGVLVYALAHWKQVKGNVEQAEAWAKHELGKN